jgi:hypothetical protein
MAYDEGLAARVRKLLSDRSDVTERAMFGGLTFMVSGHLKDSLEIRSASAV